MGFFDGLGTGILGVAGSAATSLINANTARLNTDKTNAANIQMSREAYANDLSMWNRQNEYNSPSSQMERFKLAGLNPNLIYGQGSAGNATQLPRYQAPSMRYDYSPSIDPSAMLTAFMDMRVKSAQVNNLQAQGDSIEKSNQLKDLMIKGYSPSTSTTVSMDQDGNPVMDITRKSGYYENMAKKAKTDSELSKYNADVAGKNVENKVKELSLKNDISQKQLDYFLSNMVIKGIGALGGTVAKFIPR